LLWLLVLFQPATAFGAESGWGWIETAGRWTNLAILFGVLAYFLRQPIRKFLKERLDGIGNSIQHSAELWEQAQLRLKAAEERMRDIEQDLVSVRKEAEEEAQVERGRLREQAHRDAERILESAKREIQGMTLAGQKQLREYAAGLAVDLARQRISREISDDDYTRAENRFMDSLRPVDRSSGPRR